MSEKYAQHVSVTRSFDWKGFIVFIFGICALILTVIVGLDAARHINAPVEQWKLETVTSWDEKEMLDTIIGLQKAGWTIEDISSDHCGGEYKILLRR